MKRVINGWWSIAPIKLPEKNRVYSVSQTLHTVISISVSNAMVGIWEFASDKSLAEYYPR